MWEWCRSGLSRGNMSSGGADGWAAEEVEEEAAVLSAAWSALEKESSGKGGGTVWRSLSREGEPGLVGGLVGGRVEDRKGMLGSGGGDSQGMRWGCPLRR
jgi:hypothetical protein